MKAAAWVSSVAAVGLLGATGCVSYVKPVPELELLPGPAVNFTNSNPKTVSFESLHIDMPAGTPLGEAKRGSAGSCAYPQPLIYRHSQTKVNKTNYMGVFRDAMQSAGIPVEQPAKFAGEEIKKADLQLAATIRELSINVCYPEVYKDEGHAVGEAYVSAEWSVFSPVERKIVHTATTKGRTAPGYSTRLGEDGVIGEALRQSLLRFLADPAFVVQLTEQDPKPGAKRDRVSGVPRSKPLPGGVLDNMEHLRAAVVTVFANAGQGSGFAVGQGDYVLTVAHVVSGTRFVKMTAADDRHYYGEVSYRDVVRDLALIKVSQGRLKPLPIAEANPKAGTEVYAIGSPLAEKFSLSLTKGVLSGVRKERDLEYLQSDVNILPGSSGGPLLDAQGNVVGIAVGGMGLANVPVGMNFFTSGPDLLRFLANPGKPDQQD